MVKYQITKRACGQVGNLKLLCPNVRRYKNLLLNYLQKFSMFPSAETKVQNNSKCSITYVRPTCHKPMLAAGVSVHTIFSNSLFSVSISSIFCFCSKSLSGSKLKSLYVSVLICPFFRSKYFLGSKSSPFMAKYK